MKLDSILDVKTYLIDSGIADVVDEPVIEQLTGGVSSSTWKINLKHNHWVIKQALAKLKVEAEWYSDVERIHREHEVMEALEVIVPAGKIPKVLYKDYNNHIYMMTCAEGKIQTWKEVLMEGDFLTLYADNAAAFLSDMHEKSNRLYFYEIEKLKDQKYFRQLRIDPFHNFLIEKYPWLTTPIQQLIAELTLNKTCLVHGDFSPKNMLVMEIGKLMVIDFEVAHWGNPVFDVAYCLGHLLLKGWYLDKKNEILELIESFLSSYNQKVYHLIPHLGLMLLARIDGKSPVNYIKEEDLKNEIRKIAFQWIEKREDADIMSQIKKAYGKN